MRVRTFTDDGVREARRLLDEVRANPAVDLAPLRTLVTDDNFTRRVLNAPDVEERGFNSGREVASYLEPKLSTLPRTALHDGGLWSWLGVFYFESTVRRRDGLPHLPARDHDTFLFPTAGHSAARRYRHYLWTAWRLSEQHGDTADYLLDRDLTEFGDLAKAVLGSPLRFNATGIITLIGHLYTNGVQTKRGFTSGRGSLWHLTRVLDQLERTYDIYGMELEALLKVLPADFDRWRVV